MTYKPVFFSATPAEARQSLRLLQQMRDQGSLDTLDYYTIRRRLIYAVLRVVPNAVVPRLSSPTTATEIWTGDKDGNS